ncbi:MAG: spirocyclase AveC family protein [Mycobacterium sp.]
MTTSVAGSPSAESDTSQGGIRGDAPRIVWLARIGGIFLLLELYVLGSWIFSDDFTSTPTGSDPLPASVHFWIRAWEVISIVGSIVFLAWIIRKTLRDRVLPTLGVVVIAWMFTAWQDPGVNYIRPVFAYNSHFFNRGTWAHFIPGWANHAGANPQPIFFWIATYLLFVPVFMVGACALLDGVRKLFPRINKAGLLAILFVVMILIDVLIETLWLRQGLYAYPRANHAWSLFTGDITQFPLYEAFAWGGFMTTLGAGIYYFRDADGHMISDKGLDKLKITRGRTLIRALALGAIFNLAMLVFNMGFNMANQHADTMPTQVPSYFSNQLCGLGTNPPCPPPN